MKKLHSGILGAAAAAILTACGDGGSGTNTVHNGYLSDARIQGVHFKCGESISGTTDNNGTFTYADNCQLIEFTIGRVKLGSIETSRIGEDGIIYPADLLGLDRNNTTNGRLTNWLQFVQSLDTDHYPRNGISIDSNKSTALEDVLLDLGMDNDIEDIEAGLSSLRIGLVERDFAIAHYEQTLRNEQNLSVHSITQERLDEMEVGFIQEQMTSLPTDALRGFNYQQQWSSGEDYHIEFSEPKRTPATENQEYNVTVTVTKGSATSEFQFAESVPYSQLARDEVEVRSIIDGLNNTPADSLRSFTYAQQWSSGSPYTITFDIAKKIATAIDQEYPVTITVTKGSYTDTVTLMEFVPTTNVKITLGDGSIALINDEYRDAFVVTNGGLFQKIGYEEQFIGVANSIDNSALDVNVSSSAEVLNYIIQNSNLANLNSVSGNHSSDGSIVARYEISLVERNLYELLNNFLGAVHYSIFDIDIAQYSDIEHAVIDFYIEYDAPLQTSYIIIAVTDKQLNVESDITKIVNKDSIVKQNEIIINNQETFTYSGNQRKGDFIFIMDDSGSMSEEQSSSIAAIQRTFSAAVSRYNLDWKATVMGTENGRYYDDLVSDPSENNISKLVDQLDSLATSGGNEVGLKRAYQYITSGFIEERNGSSTTMIYVSDEFCHTQLSDLGLQNNNLANSYFVQNDIRVNAIIPEDNTYEGGSGLRVNDLAYKMALATGGDVANLRNYQSGYDEMMDLAVRYAVAKSSSIKLSYPALASSITVHVNGTKSTSWEYDPSEKAIVFSQGYTPNNGDEVVVTYSHLDYASMVESAKNEFDSLADDLKRGYTNENIEVIFDPASRRVSTVDTAPYTVTVTFSKYGYTETTTFEETPVEQNYMVIQNSDWLENNNTFVSQNHTNSSESILAIDVLADTTIDYSVSSESCYDALYVSINGTSSTKYCNSNQGTLNAVTGDHIEFSYRKDGSVSSNADEARITIN